MKWWAALAIGVVVGFVIPMAFGGQFGVWMDSWASWGTVRPISGSPGVLFSIPVFLGAALAFRVFFNWHTR